VLSLLLAKSSGTALSVHCNSCPPVSFQAFLVRAEGLRKRSRTDERADETARQTNWYPLSERHTLAAMLPHLHGEPRAGRTPQPSQKKKGKAPHVPSPGSGGSEGKAGPRALTQGAEKATAWSSLS